MRESPSGRHLGSLQVAGSEEAQGMCKNSGRRGVWTRWAEGVGVLEGFNAGELGEDGVAKVGVPLKVVLVLEG